MPVDKTFDGLPRSCGRMFKDLQLWQQIVCQQAENSVENKVNTTYFDTVSLPVERTIDDFLYLM